MSKAMAYVIALYIRLSLEDSRVESMSIENQKRALHSFVDQMENVRNVEVLEFIDNGYSGTNFERPAVQNCWGRCRPARSTASSSRISPVLAATPSRSATSWSACSAIWNPLYLYQRRF